MPIHTLPATILTTIVINLYKSNKIYIISKIYPIVRYELNCMLMFCLNLDILRNGIYVDKDNIWVRNFRGVKQYLETVHVFERASIPLHHL